MIQFVGSVSDVFTFFPCAQLDRAVRINQLSFSILGTLFEMTDVNGTVCVELTTVATYLIFLVLGLKDLIVREYHAVDSMTDIGSFSKLAQPFGTLLIDNLFKFEIIPIEVKWLLYVFKEILYRKRPQLLPILQGFLLFLRIHIRYGNQQFFNFPLKIRLNQRIR